MAGTKYSQLEAEPTEAEPTDDETVGCTSEVHLRRCPHFPSLATAVAFCAGVLVAFGSIRLFENIGKRDTDWLSESLQCDTNLLGSETHDKWIEPPGDVKVQFEYNDTYPGPPTMESEYAWLDLFPGKVASNLTEEETLTHSRWSGCSPARCPERSHSDHLGVPPTALSCTFPPNKRSRMLNFRRWPYDTASTTIGTEQDTRT